MQREGVHGGKPARQASSASDAVARRVPDAGVAQEASSSSLHAVTNETAVRIIEVQRALTEAQRTLRDGSGVVNPELPARLPAELNAVRVEAIRYDEHGASDEERGRMVSTVINYAILATTQAMLRSHDRYQAPLSYTKAEILRAATLRVQDEFRTERAIPDSSRNTIFRDAEYYMVGRYMTLDNAPDSTTAKVGAGVGGLFLSGFYNLFKPVLPSRTDSDFPNAEPGGTVHAFAGALDATEEKAEDKEVPAILSVMPRVTDRWF